MVLFITAAVRTSNPTKLTLCSIKHYAMESYRGVDVYINVFLTSALDGGEWSASRPCRITPCTHWIGGRGPRTGVDDKEKRKISWPYRESNQNSSALHPVCQSLFKLQDYSHLLLQTDLWWCIYITLSFIPPCFMQFNVSVQISESFCVSCFTTLSVAQTI
jgi:hypothetical protein